jgi:hypothetical protein
MPNRTEAARRKPSRMPPGDERHCPLFPTLLAITITTVVNVNVCFQSLSDTIVGDAGNSIRPMNRIIVKPACPKMA